MNQTHAMPHHKLIAYGVARDLVVAVVAARIRDASLRDQALRAAKSAALNTAEGAGQVSPRSIRFTRSASACTRPAGSGASAPMASARSRAPTTSWRLPLAIAK